MYIVFEGPDGSGKSTMMETLAKDLENAEVDYKLASLHQPGSTQLGERLRAICKDKSLPACGTAQMYMMAADHAEFIDEHISELHPQKDYIILQDRHSAISGYAYQVVANKASYNMYLSLYGNATIRDYMPDIVVLFKPSINTILKRIDTRGEAKDRYETTAFLKKVIKGYNEVPTAGVVPKERYLIIDANCDRKTMYKRLLKGLHSHPKAPAALSLMLRPIVYGETRG